MKRTLILLLSLVMVFSAIPITPVLAAENVAYPSTQQVSVDGTAVEFQMYALKDENGNDTNYVKVRDVAYILNGTAAQFSVNWDGAVDLIPGQGYESDGSEMSTPFSGERPYTPATAPTQVNAQDAALDAIVLTDDNGGGYTYYKLRDLGAALGFTVDWSAERGVYIETETQPAAAETPYPVTLYALDGRTITVWSNEVDDYLSVGWYYAPVTQLYAADGRTLVVATSEVDAYVAVGWYTDINDAKVTLYAPDGRTIAVWNNEVDAYKAVGWSLLCPTYASSPDVPDFGALLGIRAYASSVDAEGGLYVYSLSSIQSSRYPEDYAIKYSNALESYGFVPYHSFEGSGGHTFYVYKNSNTGRLVSLDADSIGRTPCLCVLVVSNP